MIAFIIGVLIGDGVTIFSLALGKAADKRDDWKDAKE